jgi:hypothetical protein
MFYRNIYIFSELLAKSSVTYSLISRKTRKEKKNPKEEESSWKPIFTLNFERKTD